MNLEFCLDTPTFMMLKKLNVYPLNFSGFIKRREVETRMHHLDRKVLSDILKFYLSPFMT